VIKDYPREQIKITSKWGPMHTENGIFLDLSRKHCREACEDSLKRMGVDYIDLFIMRGSGPDPNTPIEESIKAMKVNLSSVEVAFHG